MEASPPEGRSEQGLVIFTWGQGVGEGPEESQDYSRGGEASEGQQDEEGGG